MRNQFRKRYVAKGIVASGDYWQKLTRLQSPMIT